MSAKTAALKAMGIQSWSQRVELPLAAKPLESKVESKETTLCYCYYWKKDGKNVACLLADYGNGSPEESNLVAAIAKALPGANEGGCRQVAAKDCQLPTVILGEGLSAQLGLNKNDSVFISHTPTELLADTKLKRHAWSQLQQLNPYL